MATADYIQLGITLVLAATLLVVLRQLLVQNRLLDAQLLAWRFDAFGRTGREITDGELEQMRLWPDNYMTMAAYERYKGDPAALRKYLGALRLYTNLAFLYALKTLRLPDPLGYEWTERWATDLLAHQEFKEVHEYLKPFYPHFAEFVDAALATESTT